MNQLATKNQALLSFAKKFDVDPVEMERTLKTTVFKQSGGKEITNEQMVMLMVVADQYNLNPFTKEIYAFPDKQGGVVPVVGVDGWSRLLNSNRHFDGMEFRQSEKMVIPQGGKLCPEWMEVVIYRKDRSRPITVREYLDEVYRPPFKDRQTGYEKAGPWQTHTKRFLRHKTMIQGARIAFGFAGIYDEDEADRILETNREAIQVEGVTIETLIDALPDQNKAKKMANKLKRKEVKTLTGEDITEDEPDVRATQADITARGKAALKGKITKSKDVESLNALHDACMEFHDSDWFADLTTAFSAKKVELENAKAL